MRRPRRGASGLGAMLLVLLGLLPMADLSALERSTAVAVVVAEGVPYFLGDMNGELYYRFDSHLWKTDGTPGGTRLLSAATPAGPHLEPCANVFCLKHYPAAGRAGGLLFLAADDGVNGPELWRSDGTPAGTQLAKDVNAPHFDPDFVGVGSLMFFVLAPPDFLPMPGDCSDRCELWRSDGTDVGTFALTPLPFSLPGRPVGAGTAGRLVFQRGADVWSSDGTLGGTGLLKAGAEFLTDSGGKVLFTASAHLWGTDGTSGGTVSLTDFPIALRGCVNGACYFSDSTPGDPVDMWTTDGTPGGTLKLVDLSIAGPNAFADVNGTVFFTNGDELWKTDGTPGGTVLVADVPSPAQLTAESGQLFFISSNQLWKSNGTAAGTTPVASFEATDTLSSIVGVGGKLLLQVRGPDCQGYRCVRDWRLYQSDGTAVGTRPVTDLASDVVHCFTPLACAGVLTPTNSSVIDGKWFFEALDSVSHAPKLWMATYVFFEDVTPSHWAFSHVETLAEVGVTAGCNPNRYCPDDPVSRAQMAVFLERGMHPPGFTPPPASGAIFADVPAGYWAASWIEQLHADGVTGGCGIAPLVYCPEAPVTRAEMAVFLLKGRHGAAYTPPPVGASTRFSDVPVTHWAAAWIEQLAAEGITGGCGSGLYCPDDPVTRAQMAVFLVKTFVP